LPPPLPLKGKTFKDTLVALPSTGHIVSKWPAEFPLKAHHEEGLRFGMFPSASSHGCLSDELLEILLF
jgi:hypothetical protein